MGWMMKWAVEPVPMHRAAGLVPVVVGWGVIVGILLPPILILAGL